MPGWAMRRELLAEALGTGLLLFMIVGSGIAAERFALDPGTALFAHAVVVGLALTVLIVIFGPLSGAHFNPVVTLALWRSHSISGAAVGWYLLAQLAGAVVGVSLANFSFDVPTAISGRARLGGGTAVSELVATFVLVLLILVLVRIGRTALVAPAVGAWIAAAVFGTASTSFANPVVTVTRVLTDTYTGIAPASVPGFVVSQFAGAGLAVWAAAVLAPVGEEQT